MNLCLIVKFRTDSVEHTALLIQPLDEFRCPCGLTHTSFVVVHKDARTTEYSSRCLAISQREIVDQRSAPGA